MQPGRSYNNSGYRYGFNGQERSDEVKGDGSSYTAEFWEYDSRIGRRWNSDPKPKVWESPYLCFSGNPISLSDIKGDSAIAPTSTSQTDKDYNPWMSLLTLNLPKKLLNLANKRFTIQDFNDQRLSMATGANLNLDRYIVNINKLPGKFKRCNI